MGQFSVNVFLRGVADGFEWACTGVYDPNDDSQQGALWELAEILLVQTWSLIGDFNLIRYPSERIGWDSFSPAKFAFSYFIKDNNVVDLPLEGASFTWLRDFDTSSMSRIDRTLVLVDWIDHFVDVSQRVLPCVVSYHCPLLVKASGISRGWCAFKFEICGWRLMVLLRVQQ